MKLSDWKARLQALFRPAPRDLAQPALQQAPPAKANAGKPVEIFIPSTGERFVHDPSLTRQASELDLSDELGSISPPDIFETREQAVAQALQRWDGRSVHDIPVAHFYDHPELEGHPVLQTTVPVIVRQARWHPAPQDPAYRTSVTVLAIDRAGQALIKHYAVDDSRDADGWSYSVLPLDKATQLLREHGMVERLDLEPTKHLLHGAMQIQTAIAGATYRGQILAIEGDIAYQAADTRRAIEHQLGKLAIEDPHQLIGKAVEISYPCGQVGLVRPIDAIALTTPELQRSVGEKTADGLER